MLLPLLLFTAVAASAETEANVNIREETAGIAAAIDSQPEQIKRDHGSVWSDWVVATPCSDTCGACGTTHLLRECLCAGEEGCPCSEREFRVEVCEKKLCAFPRKSCCEGFRKAAIGNSLICGPIDETIERKIIEKESLVASRKFLEPKNEEIVATPEAAEVEGKVWGDWSVGTPCTDTCGACGTAALVRECLCAGREGCPCSERETRVEVCGTRMCEFPRKTCCDGYTKVRSPNGFICGPKETSTGQRQAAKEQPAPSLSNAKLANEKKNEVANTESNVDGGAVWSEWIVSTPCTDTCGACGTAALVRECLCAGREGCPCSERETRVEVCGTRMCEFPRKTCCEGYTKVRSPNGFICGQKEAPSLSNAKLAHEKRNEVANTESNVDGAVWSEWIVSSPCTDTCGACGKITYTRSCLCEGVEGCPCSELETREEVCGTGMCEFPRKTCCEGFVKVHTANGFKCGPKEEAIAQQRRAGLDKLNTSSIKLRKRPEVPTHSHSDAPKQRASKTHSVAPIRFNTKAEGTAWSEWIISTPCTDTCGACGKVTFTRSCLCAGEEGCPCSRRQTKTDVCGVGLCPFPRHTCCPPARKTLTAEGFECVVEEKIQPSDNVIVSNPEPSSQLFPLSPDYLSASSRSLFEKNEADSITDLPLVTSAPLNKEHLAVWGQWVVAVPCTDTCGSCGRIHLTRECLCAGEEGCPCSQRESRVEVCATQLCSFPRHTCCNGFVKVSTHDGFRCVAEKENDERICAGRWTPWEEVDSVSECSAKCGMCGKKRVATRKCEPENCECSGETELFEPCGRHPCREGEECCEGFVKGRVDGREECVPNASIPPSLSAASRKFLDKKKAEERKAMEERKSQLKQILPVLDSPSNCTWSEWSEIDSECSGSCGMCGVRVSARRNCHPIGCNCVGPSTRYEDCGEGICEDREKPCCGYYTVSTVNGYSSCVDPVGGGVPKENRRETPIRRTPEKKPAVQRDASSTSTCRGIWSPFSAAPSSPCSHSCGLCGHRSVAERECIPEGCTCEGSNKLYERCAEKPCWNKKDGCCEGASIVLVDGKRICKEINK